LCAYPFDAKECENTGQLPAKNENGEFPFGCFFPLFPEALWCGKPKLAFQLHWFLFQEFEQVFREVLPDMGSSESALRDMEEPSKEAVNSSVLKED